MGIFSLCWKNNILIKTKESITKILGITKPSLIIFHSLANLRVYEDRNLNIIHIFSFCKKVLYFLRLSRLKFHSFVRNRSVQLTSVVCNR